MSKTKTIDLTSGPILKTLAELALPIMASSLLGTAYNITDMAWIGLLGAKAVAGVGGGGLIALFRRALAQRVIVGEGLSRLNDDPVEGFAEQAQIGIAVFIVAVLRLAGAENIPEINGIRISVSRKSG